MIAPVRSARDESLDALKAAVTALVIFHHAAITYGGAGGWFYREIPENDSLSSRLLALFNSWNQAWFMGMFFLIAGYFTPRAAARRGIVGFLRERALRLGLPLLAFMLLIGPATVALAQTVHGDRFVDVLLWLWRHGRVYVGPLWFAEALLIFSVVYALVAPWLAGRAPAFPSNRALAMAAVGVGLANFAVRLVWPTGTSWLELQLGYFPAYLLLFFAGCRVASWPTLDAAPDAQRRLWRGVELATFFVLPLTAALWKPLTGADPEFRGGWRGPALIISFWEPFVAWGVTLGALHGFRRFARLGPWGRRFARAAYGAYVVHPFFLVGLAVAGRDVAAPALLKFAVTGSLATLASWLGAGALLQIPGVRRVL